MGTAMRESDSTNDRRSAATTSVRPSGRPRKGSRDNKVEYRLQVKLTEAGKERLDEVIERVDGESAAHVVRDALRVYDILTEEVLAKGGQLLIKDGETGDVMRLRLW